MKEEITNEKLKLVHNNFVNFIEISCSILTRNIDDFVFEYLFEDFDIDLNTSFDKSTLLILLENQKINDDVFLYAYTAKNYFNELEKLKRIEEEIISSIQFYFIKKLLLKIKREIDINRYDQNEVSKILNIFNES